MSGTPSILVVDDRAINRHFLMTLLGYAGYRTSEAADGAEALEAARRAPPDLIITDILMPVMDGEEFVRRLRTEADLAAVPIVFYTATFQARDARKIADGCGVQAVLAKPSDPEEILAVVSRLLGPAALPGGSALSEASDDGPVQFVGGIGERVTDCLRNLETFGSEVNRAIEEGEKAIRERDQLRSLCSDMTASASRLQAVPLKLASLVEFGMRLTGRRDPDALIGLFASAAQSILGVRIVGAGLVDDVDGSLSHFDSRGLPSDLRRPSARAGVLGEVLVSGRPRLVDARGKDPAMFGLPNDHPGVMSLLVVPITGRAASLGWLYVADPVATDAFDSVDEQLATTLASQFAVAVEDARLHAEVQSHAAVLRNEIAARRTAEDRYRSLFEEAAEGILRTSAEQRVLAANPAMLRILGYESEEQFRSEVTNFENQVVVDPADCVAFHRAIEAAGKVVNFESRFRKRDGSTIWIRAHVRAVCLPSGELKAFEGMVTDVTKERTLQEQLNHAMRIEAVGRLAGGVAHDFNNILMVILGQASLLLPRVAGDERVQRGLLDIEEAGQKAATLTRQLLAFSRKQVLQPQLLDASAILKNLEQMLKRVIGEDILLEIAPRKDAWLVLADPGQIEQVIVNLAVNARDAMPLGGSLTIETSNRRFEPHLPLSEGGVPEGDYLCISVSDSGTGMDKAVRDRLFEPFFTTKGEGRGTGLGLATSYGIIRQSGGTIAVYSEPGLGSTFNVYLPRAQVTVAASNQEAEEGVIPTGTETILMAEDESTVRQVAKSLLDTLGYTVLEASSGAAALELLDGYAGPVHLLLTDAVMPGMSGRELAQKAIAVRPDLKVIFMSGYTDDAVVRHGILAREVAFLQKPFTLRDLANKIRETLDEKTGSMR